ncbi:hypothetical protein D3C86_1593630 [compost metagenome]
MIALNGSREGLLAPGAGRWKEIRAAAPMAERAANSGSPCGAGSPIGSRMPARSRWARPMARASASMRPAILAASAAPSAARRCAIARCAKPASARLPASSCPGSARSFGPSASNSSAP